MELNVTEQPIITISTVQNINGVWTDAITTQMTSLDKALVAFEGRVGYDLQNQEVTYRNDRTGIVATAGKDCPTIVTLDFNINIRHPFIKFIYDIEPQEDTPMWEYYAIESYLTLWQHEVAGDNYIVDRIGSVETNIVACPVCDDTFEGDDAIGTAFEMVELVHSYLRCRVCGTLICTDTDIDNLEADDHWFLLNVFNDRFERLSRKGDSLATEYTTVAQNISSTKLQTWVVLTGREFVESVNFKRSAVNENHWSVAVTHSRPLYTVNEEFKVHEILESVIDGLNRAVKADREYENL